MRLRLMRSSADERTPLHRSLGRSPDEGAWSTAAAGQVSSAQPAYNIGSMGVYPRTGQATGVPDTPALSIVMRQEDAGVSEPFDGGVSDAGPGGESLPGGVAEPASPYEPPAPRTITSITAKRRNINLGTGDMGHWWTEIDGRESYGWWPKPRNCESGNPEGGTVWDALFGTEGELNAKSCPTLGGSATRDPHHGQTAEEQFHPISTTGNTDDQIKDSIRDFAKGYHGEWRWSVGGEDCHAFQEDLLRSAALNLPGE